MPNLDYLYITNIAISGTNTNCNSNPYSLIWSTGNQNTNSISPVINSDTSFYAYGINLTGDTVCQSLPAHITILGAPQFNVIDTVFSPSCPEDSVSLELEFTEILGPFTFSQNGIYDSLNNTFDINSRMW